MFKQIKTLLLFAMLSSLGLTAMANKDTQINLPRGTVEGFLDNGLHYIIMPNALPRHGVEMRLVMRVGSLQESDQQKGGAHFLEHMAFAGTTHYPHNAWVDYFECLGMKYGRDINAFTGFDRTIYWLSLPVADFGSQVMDSTLLAVRDILDGITFDAKSIEKERGVIREELRGYSTGDEFYGLKIGTGRYVQRMPLGSEHDIDTVSRNQLLDFYSKWYLPKNACLVVVGNVDAQDVQNRIRTIFGDVAYGHPVGIEKHSLLYKKGVTLHEVMDTVGTTSKLEFIIPHHGVVANTIASTVLKEQYRLLVTALAKRMAAQGVRCDINDAWYLADQNHFSMTVEGKGKQELQDHAMKALGILSHVASKGFVAEELADDLQDKLAKMRVDTIGFQSSKWCDDFVDYVISGDRYVSWNEDMAKVKEQVSQTTNAQLQKLLGEILDEAKRTLLVAYQNNGGKSDSFSEKELEKLWKQGMKIRLPKYEYHRKAMEEPSRVVIPQCLSAIHADASSAVAKKQHYADIGVTEYTLANGLKIVLRPTTDKDSTVFLAMLGRGGLGDLDKKDYPFLRDAASYVDMGGLAHVSSDSLAEVMQSEDLSMSIGIDEYWHQVLASAPTAKVQELANMVYEKITAPGKAYKDFEEVRDSEKENFGNESLLDRLLKRDTDRMLSRKVDSLVCNIPANSGVEMKKEDLDKLSLDSMTDYYTNLFGNPRQTTLILTGNFNIEEVCQIMVNTFARLQHTSQMTDYEDKPSKMPTTRYREGFESDVESQTVLNYIYPGNYQPSLRQSLLLKLMRDVMQNRLLEVLREKLNIVYSPYADLYYSGKPQAKYYFWLTVAVKNENRDKANEALKEIIADLQKNPISERELSKLKMSFLVTKRKALSDDAPSEWKNVLTSLVHNGESLVDYDNYTKCLQGITPEDVRQGFEKYVCSERMALLYKGKTF